LSKDPSVSEIKKHAKIWDKMHNGNDIVQSNYGWQWERNNQLQYCIDELLRDNNTRRAFISIYDGKEHENYSHDTPCTLSIGFNIVNNKLNMMVQMRSNDLWYGFCNDQYCFSKLQEHVSKMVNKEIGWYYHFVNNLHIYNDFLNKNCG
jgi:thymidylate synthase